MPPGIAARIKNAKQEYVYSGSLPVSFEDFRLLRFWVALAHVSQCLWPQVRAQGRKQKGTPDVCSRGGNTG